MDFYHIGAMKVFSQLGKLIEEDEIILSDLPIDIMQKIGSYLLQDPNKKVHKIFKNRPDDDLQVLLFGEVKDLTYINIYDSNNKINYPMNYKLLDYVNYILKVKGVKLTLEKMKINFYRHQYKIMSEAKVIIEFYNKEDIQKAVITEVYYIGRGIFGTGGGYNYVLSYRHDNKWNEQNIKKKDITDEYESIKEEIINKYF
jgi:phosphomevalonate kinase